MDVRVYALLFQGRQIKAGDSVKGWTLEDAKARGFTECNPQGVSRSMGGLIVPRVIPVIKYAPPAKERLNKTETEYLRMLEARKKAGEIKEIYGHQGIKFQVGLTRCFYSPDFPVMGSDGVLELHEVKGGHVWDDARVKFQACKLRYWSCRWVWAQKTNGEWRIER